MFHSVRQNEPRYPIYIISKGRWEQRLTSRALEKMHVPYRIVIEPQEYSDYAAVINPAKILVLPFSNLGQGSIPARNWVWDHAINQGYLRHWILDDNISAFFRFHNNTYYYMRSGASFCAIEDFVDRYKNIAQAGMQYFMFVIRRNKYEPFIMNTRVYSCMLIDNRIPFRWRGRYNEDTDLSLRILKNGYCTILFNAFPAQKEPTMKYKGGNTDELYRKDANFDGRLEMALSLQRQHPDVVKVGRRWGRWQHVVDYRPFRNNKLIRRKGIEIPHEANEYGMILIDPK